IHKIKVKVVDLYRVDPNTMVQTSIASFPNYIYLEAGFSAERYYKLNVPQVPGLGVQFLEYDEYGNITSAVTGTSTGAATNELLVNWDYVPGAEAYDLEWTWIDNYPSTIGGPPRAANTMPLTEFDFRTNST